MEVNAESALCSFILSRVIALLSFSSIQKELLYILYIHLHRRVHLVTDTLMIGMGNYSKGMHVSIYINNQVS